MFRGLVLGGLGCLSGYFTFHLWLTQTNPTANGALELFGLFTLTLIFLWNSLSYLLLDVGKNGQYRHILQFVSRYGSPRARRLALTAVLLYPVPAYASPISDYSPNLESCEYGVQTIHSTPVLLRQVHLKPAALNTGITVRPGDTLWSIAQQISSQFPDVSLAQITTGLWENNRDLIDDPNIIYPGQHLELPTFRK